MTSWLDDKISDPNGHNAMKHHQARIDAAIEARGDNNQQSAMGGIFSKARDLIDAGRALRVNLSESLTGRVANGALNIGTAGIATVLLISQLNSGSADPSNHIKQAPSTHEIAME